MKVASAVQLVVAIPREEKLTPVVTSASSPYPYLAHHGPFDAASALFLIAFKSRLTTAFSSSFLLPLKYRQFPMNSYRHSMPLSLFLCHASLNNR
jgi:hypothetical protein